MSHIWMTYKHGGRGIHISHNSYIKLFLCRFYLSSQHGRGTLWKFWPLFFCIGSCNALMLTKPRAKTSSERRTLLWWTPQTNNSHKFGTFDFKNENESFYCLTFRQLGCLKKPIKLYFFKIELVRIVSERCLLLFRISYWDTTYSEITQRTKIVGTK